MVYSRRSPERRGVQLVTHSGGATSADPVVRATAETTTPDLAAIAALAAALAVYGRAAVTVAEVARCPIMRARR